MKDTRNRVKSKCERESGIGVKNKTQRTLSSTDNHNTPLDHGRKGHLGLDLAYENNKEISRIRDPTVGKQKRKLGWNGIKAHSRCNRRWLFIIWGTGVLRGGCAQRAREKEGHRTYVAVAG